MGRRYDHVMARMRIDGQWFQVDDDGVEDLKSKLRSLGPGEFLEMNLEGDSPGTTSWVKVPAEVAVVIIPS